ncbi:CHAT domain-containing protein [Streptomyces sp. SAI-129]|uniref:CHAT domain-containing protein n=1 Tax=Streptomyces sp. SAI-129 TaxID=3377727 RepID=UPI003C7B4C90
MVSMWSETGLLPQPRSGVHYARLTISAEEIASLSARLISRWQQFVQYEPVSRSNRLREQKPFLHNADLSGHPQSELLGWVGELAREGAYLLDELLAGEEGELARFRDHLLSLLDRENLRIRFDSDLDVPWPMLVVGYDSLLDAGLLAHDPFQLFLGHRHQIESTSGAYADYWWVSDRSRAVGSVNLDLELENVTLAADVVKLLENRFDLTTRHFSHELLSDLARPVLDEDLMYFFCHGSYEEHGGRSWHALRLSDELTVDAPLVDGIRKSHTRAAARRGTVSLFHPLVVLNTCYAGAPATTGFTGLSAAFVEHGALGVLAPQVAVPQVFGAEFALEFLNRYLHQEMTAGLALLETVRWFAAAYRNPLALVYGLVCGLDSRVRSSSPEGMTGP